MKYRISYTQPHHQVLTVEFWAQPSEWLSELIMVLPKWRPGRYELANYAKNVYRLEAWNGSEEPLAVRKSDTGTWLIETGNATEVHGKYTYRATQMDAGGSWLDAHQLYVSPVNCLMQAEGLQYEEHTLEVVVPDEYTIACALPQPERGKLVAQDYQELVDSPLIASPTLDHWQYTVEHHTFHLWVQGNEGLQAADLLPDFEAFTRAQMAMFGGFPNPDYHFLIQLLPYSYYHGVEHKNSTVLALGPADRVTDRKPYRDFVGVASHELFHVWNVTRIRPAEMMPYDFIREAYHHTGYITEGVTMYYGDLMLVQAGVYSLAEYLEEVNVLLKRHGQNFGRHNLSILESSHDLWLDGYSPAAPERRQSIYVEGFVLAWALDFEIRAHTEGQRSLADVMRLLWVNFGQKAIGYTQADYWDAVVAVCPNLDVNSYFGAHYADTQSVLPALDGHLRQQVGYRLALQVPTDPLERAFGVLLQTTGGEYKVAKLDPEGPAYAQLAHGDEITHLNHQALVEGMPQLADGEPITLRVERPFESLTVTLQPTGRDYLTWLGLEPDPEAGEEQKQNAKVWLAKA